MADLTVSADIDTFMGSADKAAMRTAIGLAAIAAGEGFGYADGKFTRLAANSLSVDASLTLAGGTRTTSVPLINGTQTWNDAGVTFVGDKMNITDTLSAAESLLWERQLNSQRKHEFTKTGLRIYNSWTSDSVYERGFMRWVSNVLEIGTEHVGATLRDLRLNSSTIQFYTNSIERGGFDNGRWKATEYGGSNLPSFIGLNDTNSGLALWDSDKLSLMTGGSHRLTCDASGNVGIGVTSPNANAILDVSSTTKAFLPPRMTETERDAIASPTAGMVVYNTTTGKLNIRGVSAWEAITSA